MKAEDFIKKQITEDHNTRQMVNRLDALEKLTLTYLLEKYLTEVKKMSVMRCCETSIADFQINDKITFKQHRSGIVTDVYINELQVKDVNGNYKTIGKSDVIEKH